MNILQGLLDIITQVSLQTEVFRVCLVLRLLLWLWFEKSYFIKSTFS
jgi:hypothetical protein